jgi:hypothetical protein
VPKFDAEIKGFVIHDDLDVEITVTNVPEGQTIVEAWMTIKTVPTNPDTEVVQKHITPSFVSGQGQITDTGSSGTAKLLFTLTSVDTGKLVVGTTYVYDAQTLTSAGKHFTPEIGTMLSTQEVTLAE